jgi:hypothetical protein
LWLGFHNVDQDGYLDMVLGYAEHLGFALEPDEEGAALAIPRALAVWPNSMHLVMLEELGYSFDACGQCCSTRERSTSVLGDHDTNLAFGNGRPVPIPR